MGHWGGKLLICFGDAKAHWGSLERLFLWSDVPCGHAGEDLISPASFAGRPCFPIISAITSLTIGIIFTIKDIFLLFRILKCHYSVAELALSY